MTNYIGNSLIYTNGFDANNQWICTKLVIKYFLDNAVTRGNVLKLISTIIHIVDVDIKKIVWDFCF